MTHSHPATLPLHFQTNTTVSHWQWSWCSKTNQYFLRHLCLSFPTQSLRDERAAKGAARFELSEPAADDPAAGLDTTDGPQQVPEEGEDGQDGVCDGDTAQDKATEVQQDVEDDSDDSEVSDVYEEEEVDEEEDYEEEDGLNSGMTHSLCC